MRAGCGHAPAGRRVLPRRARTRAVAREQLIVLSGGQLAILVTAPDAAIEIDALREGRAESLGLMLWHVRVEVTAARHEFDDELAAVRVVVEAANHGRRHLGHTNA